MPANNIGYDANAYTGEYISTQSTGGNTQIKPESKYTQLWARIIEHQNGNYQLLYTQDKQDLVFAKGQAAALNVTFNRLHPLVSPYKNHEVKIEGDRNDAVRITFQQFNIDAKQYMIWMEFGDRSHLTDYYGLIDRSASQILNWTQRAITEISRDTLITGGSRHFAPKKDGTAGVANKTTVGYFQIADAISKVNELRKNGYSGPYQLMLSEETSDFIKYEKDSVVAEALQRQENTLGLNSRVKNFGFMGKIGNLEIYKTTSPAYTYGTADSAGGTNEYGGTNAPVNLDVLGSGKTDYQIGNGANNARLDISVLRVGESAYRLRVMDGVASPGPSNLIYHGFGSAGSEDAGNQKSTLASKFYYGAKVTDPNGIHSWFHLEAPATEYMKTN